MVNVEEWKKAILSPFYKKRLVIVTDCISYDVLKEKMMKLYYGEGFGEKKKQYPCYGLFLFSFLRVRRMELNLCFIAKKNRLW